MTRHRNTPARDSLAHRQLAAGDLAVNHGLTVTEIAERLGCHRNTIRADLEAMEIIPTPEVKRGPKPKPFEHGTERGYRQHRRRDIPLCAECREAHNTHVRERARKRRGDTTPEPPKIINRKRLATPAPDCGTPEAKRRQRRAGQVCPTCAARTRRARADRARAQREATS